MEVVSDNPDGVVVVVVSAMGDSMPGDYKGSQQFELAFPDFIVYGSGAHL